MIMEAPDTLAGYPVQTSTILDTGDTADHVRRHLRRLVATARRILVGRRHSGEPV